VECPVPSFSHSRIDTFETCRLQYKYHYIDHVRVEVEDTVEAFLGSKVHDSLELLYRHVRFAKIMNPEELKADFNTRWERDWKDSIKIVREDYSRDNYRRMGEKYLRDYYNRHSPFDEGRIIGLETQNFLSLDEDRRYKYHVRIDRLMDMGGGLYEVHDYKTNMKLSSQEDLDEDRQLAMYSLWVRGRFKDFRKVRLVWHFLAFDKEMESFRTAEELEDLKREVLSGIKRIEAEETFPPTESVLCSWCLYRAVCPLWKHEAEVENLPENEFLGDPGVRLVDEYVRIKEALDIHRSDAGEMLDKLKAAIVDFCEREGVSSVVGSAHRISVNKTEKRVFPPKNSPERRELMDILRGAGRLDEVSELDSFALNRILQDEQGTWSEDLLNDLRKYEIRRKEIRLSVRKKKP
jgi:putative RecB family exonuclease